MCNFFRPTTVMYALYSLVQAKPNLIWRHINLSGASNQTSIFSSSRISKKVELLFKNLSTTNVYLWWARLRSGKNVKSIWALRVASKIDRDFNGAKLPSSAPEKALQVASLPKLKQRTTAIFPGAHPNGACALPRAIFLASDEFCLNFEVNAKSFVARKTKGKRILRKKPDDWNLIDSINSHAYSGPSIIFMEYCTFQGI